MVKPSINDILEKINNRYYLVGTVAKRAREIVDGSEIYVENKQGENKPVCLASEEVAEGKITYRLLTPEEIEQKEYEHHLEQEIAIYADKSSITEEIVRFNSHITQLKNTVVKDDSVGRKMDFLIQEMNREINTMGSKSSDINITNLVVEVKSELEKIREQIQNIE